MNNKIRLFVNIFTLIVTSFLLIFFIFGWYTSNKNVNANGISASSADVKNIFIEKYLNTIRYNLNKDIIYDTYEVSSDGMLYLIERHTDYYDSNKTDETVSYSVVDKKPFFISEMLPGEYIDIKIGFSMSELKNNTSFKICLNNVSGDTFKLDESDLCYHNASCAFKYASVSLYDSFNNKIFDNSESITYKWFNIPKIDESDPISFDINLCSETWKSSYVKLYYTFRIFEDFEKYYDLINEASNVKEALLSNLNLKIDKIYIL